MLRLQPLTAALVLWTALLLGCSAQIGTDSQTSRETVLDGFVHIEQRLLEVPDVPRLDESVSLKKRSVDVDGGVELYVLEEGDGPAMVLINGGPGNTLHSFIPHFSAAAAFSHVIYYDQRGTGLSDWKTETSGYSTSQSVDDLDAIRSALGFDRWFVLGHSYGGVIAQWYALRYPEHVLGMVLVGSSVPMSGLDLGERDYRSQVERRRIREIYAIDGQAVVPVHDERVDLTTLRRMVYNGYLNGDWKRQFFFKPDPERMAQIARYEWVHDRGFNRQVRTEGFSLDLRGAFADCPIPTLIIEGAHDANWGPEKPERFAAEHPHADLVVLSRSSHFPFAEEPEAFFSVLAQFVGSKSESPVSMDRISAWKRSVGER